MRKWRRFVMTPIGEATECDMAMNLSSTLGSTGPLSIGSFREKVQYIGSRTKIDERYMYNFMHKKP